MSVPDHNKMFQIESLKTKIMGNSCKLEKGDMLQIGPKKENKLKTNDRFCMLKEDGDLDEEDGMHCYNNTCYDSKRLFLHVAR